MTTIDISGLDKLALVRALWTAAPPASFFTANHIPPPPFDEAEARAALAGYIDYLCGRIIKTNLSKDQMIVSSAYEADAGKGTTERVVAAVRAAAA